MHGGRLQRGSAAVPGLWPHDPNTGEWWGGLWLWGGCVPHCRHLPGVLWSRVGGEGVKLLGLSVPQEQYIELYRCLDNALVHGLP